MTVVVLQVVQLVVVVGVAASVLRVLQPRGSATEAQVTRRRAE